MAVFTFGPAHGFPVGITVQAFEDKGQQPSGSPMGPAAVASGVVGGTGALAIAGLTEGKRYWAVGQVNGGWKWVQIYAERAFETPGEGPLEEELRDFIRIVKEAPLNVEWPEFASKRQGNDWAPVLNAVNDHIGDSFGAEVVVPGAALTLETQPTITKDNVKLRGIGRPQLTLDRIVVQADGFSAEGFDVVGAVGLSARPFYIDPDGAGRTLRDFWFDDIRGTDTFYLIDFRGSATHGIERVRWGNRIFSDRVLTGNAGHLNLFYVHDVEGHGVSARGGQNSASVNCGFCSGPITLYGVHDKDNAPSGGGVNFENFIGDGLVSLIGGSLGWGLSGEDAFAVTFDDVQRILMLGVICGGYVRVTTSSSPVQRVKIADSQMTRFFAGDTSGTPATPQYIDELFLEHNLITGVPGVQLPDGISLDDFVRKARVVSNDIRRFQADGVTENWTNSAFKVVRSANLDLYLDDNDYGGRPVEAALTGGKIEFGPRNRNFGTLTGIPKRVNTVSSNADFTLTPFESAEHTIHTGALSTARVVTLSTTGAVTGQRFKLTRIGTGASGLTFAGKSLAINQWAEATFDGSAWVLTAFGSL